MGRGRRDKIGTIPAIQVQPNNPQPADRASHVALPSSFLAATHVFVIALHLAPGQARGKCLFADTLAVGSLFSFSRHCARDFKVGLGCTGAFSVAQKIWNAHPSRW